MAITLVGAETNTVTGEHPTVNSISVPYPVIAAGDTLHLLVVLPMYRWYVPQYTTMILARQYGISVPVGWELVGSDAINPHVGHESTAQFQQISLLLRKRAIGNETGNVDISITRANLRPDLSVPNEAVFASASLIAHRGVALGDSYDQPPIFRAAAYAGAPVGHATSTSSRLVELNATYATGLADTVPMAAWSNPAPTVQGKPPTEWDVQDQVSSTTGLVRIRTSAMDQDTFTVGTFYTAEVPVTSGATRQGASMVLFALRDEGEAPPTDPPPASGQVGVTGSGSLTPEWSGRDHVIMNPLLCSIWAEGRDAYDDPDLVELADTDAAPQPVSADLLFNGLGACTSGVVSFPSHPGLQPYVHALKLHLVTNAGGTPPVWWTGVVTNVRFENGLYNVDLDGLWSILNEARVAVAYDEIQEPVHPVIAGTLVLGIGDPNTILVDDVGAQQTWGEHLNNRFRTTPSAAWGIGPDQVFIVGQPEQGGVLTVDVDNEPAITAVEAGEFIHPPYITEWWAVDSSGAVLTAEVYPPPDLLTPARLTRGEVDDLGNLITPPAADFPLISGPSHKLEVAGIAIPPLQMMNLPNGEAQMVASARVQVTLGEEGSMPRVTTTLTTVALPYEGVR